MSQYSYASAYSPPFTLTPWDDSPELFPLLPEGDNLEANDEHDDRPSSLLTATGGLFHILQRRPSSRTSHRPSPSQLRPSPSQLRPSPSQLLRPTDTHVQQTYYPGSALPPFRFSLSPDPFDDMDFDSLDAEELAELERPSQNTRESSVVDLTESAPSPTRSLSTSNMAPGRKRKAETPVGGRANKITRGDAAPTSPRAAPSGPQSSPEMVDLVDIDDDEKYEDFKAKRQAELIKQQQLEEASKPVKLAEFQCIICMDNPTDLTVTHCGHLFCSECLHQALYAGYAKKSCPVCRTTISTTLQGKDKKLPKNGVFVMEMKLMTAKRRK